MTGCWDDDTTWTQQEIDLFTSLKIKISPVKVDKVEEENSINIDELLKDDIESEMVAEDTSTKMLSSKCPLADCDMEVDESMIKKRQHVGMIHLRLELETITQETFEDNVCTFCGSSFVASVGRMKHLLVKHEALKERLDQVIASGRVTLVKESLTPKLIRDRKKRKSSDSEGKLVNSPQVKRCKVLLKNVGSPVLTDIKKEPKIASSSKEQSSNERLKEIKDSPLVKKCQVVLQNVGSPVINHDRIKVESSFVEDQSNPQNGDDHNNKPLGYLTKEKIGEILISANPKKTDNLDTTVDNFEKVLKSQKELRRTPVSKKPVTPKSRNSSKKKVADNMKSCKGKESVEKEREDSKILNKVFLDENPLCDDDDTRIEETLAEIVNIQESPRMVELSFKKKMDRNKLLEEASTTSEEEVLNENDNCSNLLSDIDRIVSSLRNNEYLSIDKLDSFTISPRIEEDKASTQSPISKQSCVKPEKVEDDSILIEDEPSQEDQEASLHISEFDVDLQRSLMMDQELSDDEEDGENHFTIDQDDTAAKFADARESLMKEFGIED